MGWNRSLSPKRVSNRALRRQATRSLQEGGKVYALLLGCLAQRGGEITLSKGTLGHVGDNLRELGYTVTPTADGELVVKLTSGVDEAPTTVPDGTGFASPENVDTSGEPFDDDEEDNEDDHMEAEEPHGE